MLSDAGAGGATMNTAAIIRPKREHREEAENRPHDAPGERRCRTNYTRDFNKPLTMRTPAHGFGRLG